jgi:hypothetical protein
MVDLTNLNSMVSKFKRFCQGKFQEDKVNYGVVIKKLKILSFFFVHSLPGFFFEKLSIH